MPEEKSLTDTFEMFRRLWGPLGLPVPGMAMPTLDPQEVDKRLTDLRSIETWLTMNLNMVRLSIQGLEVQKAALLAMRAATGGAAAATEKGKSGATGAEGSADVPPMFWPWSVVQQALAAAAVPAKSGGGASDLGEEDGKQDAGT